MANRPLTEPLPPVEKTTWKQVLTIGLLLFAIGVAVLRTTNNVKLFPTVTMIGSFLVPVVFTAYIYQHRRLSRLTLGTTALTFFYGGVLGAFAASLFEPIFIRRLTFESAFLVGLIEEAAKIIGVVLIAWNRCDKTEINGIVLGAAAGMGFAAVESNGYALQAFLSSKGSLDAVVFTTLLRGVMSPLGHGTWTAILGAVLFRESSRCYFKLDTRVIGAYFLVAGLHGLWDGVPSLIGRLGLPDAGAFGSMTIVGVAGIAILLRLWHDAIRREVAPLIDLDKAA
jgi:RsiW-degrading membrane proteinase PrsW (M82 family)